MGRRRHWLERAYTIEWAQETGTEGLSEDAAAVRRLEQRFRDTDDLPARPGPEPVLLPPSGDLFADRTYELTRHISWAAQDDDIKVLLAGQGGDELFGGYRRRAVASALPRRTHGRTGTRSCRGEPCRRRICGPSRASYPQLCSYSTAPERARAIGCTEVEVSNDVVWAQHRAAYEPQYSAAS